MTVHRCTCADVPGAGAPGCLGWFEAADPARVCGDPICPPCHRAFLALLRRLARRGVTVRGAGA